MARPVKGSYTPAVRRHLAWRPWALRSPPRPCRVIQCGPSGLSGGRTQKIRPGVWVLPGKESLRAYHFLHSNASRAGKSARPGISHPDSRLTMLDPADMLGPLPNAVPTDRVVLQMILECFLSAQAERPARAFAPGSVRLNDGGGDRADAAPVRSARGRERRRETPYLGAPPTRATTSRRARPPRSSRRKCSALAPPPRPGRS